MYVIDAKTEGTKQFSNLKPKAVAPKCSESTDYKEQNEGGCAIRHLVRMND